MVLQILGFGIAREIFGGSKIEVEIGEGATVGQLKALLRARYPRLGGLASFQVAQGAAFADDAEALRPHEEIALIPPVSGG